jgi:hypothetical protein
MSNSAEKSPPQDEAPAGGGMGRQGGLSSKDIQQGAGVTGGPDTVGEQDDVHGISGNSGPDSSATSG